MRQKTINLRNQGSFDKKNLIFFPDPKSHTQVGSLSAKNTSEKFSRLGTFNCPRTLLSSKGEKDQAETGHCRERSKLIPDKSITLKLNVNNEVATLY
jgi:hypothetical protein